MPASLIRLLKIRCILEESSRLDLERRVALSTRIDRARQRETASIHASRERVLETIVDTSDPQQERSRRRIMGWASVENVSARRQQLQEMANSAESGMIGARKTFLECRMQRQQVESVLDEEKARGRIEQERRTQRELDDWFSLRRIQQRPNLLRNDSRS